MLLVVQTMGVAFIIGGLSSYYGGRSVDDLAASLASESAQAVEARVGTLLELPQLVNGLEADALELGGLLPYVGRSPEVEQVFWRNLRRFPISLSYMGLPDGRYVGARRNASGAVTISIVDEESGWENSRYRTDERGLRTEIDASGSGIPYDPRERPWYRVAVAAPGPTWTPIYTDTGTGTLAITASRALRDEVGDVVGVIATDLLLGPLSDLLKGADAREHGLALIVDDAGALVASSSGGVPVRATDDGAERLQADRSPDPVVAAVGRALAVSDAEGISRVTTASGEEHYLHVARFEDDFGLSWRVAVTVPRAALMAHVDENLRSTLLVGMVATLLASLLGAFLTRRVTHPLILVSDQMKDVAVLRFEGEETKPSWLTEIAHIQLAMDSMRLGLRAFERYVPADLVRELMRTGREATLGLEEREISMFFCDLEGFTSITEILEPMQLAELMESYLGEMSAIVLSERGTLDKYIGDAIMAFWNAPEALVDHPERAAQAALSCQRRLGELRQDYAAKGLPQLRMRVGLHVGDGLVGNLGSARRMDYTVIGDMVNLTSRLESLCRVYGAEILITEDLADRISHRFVVRRVDRVMMKGRAGATEVFELLSETFDDPLRDRVSRYEEALAAYRSQRFQEAVEQLQRLCSDHPGDRPAAVLRDRCQAYLAAPPGPDWDGVFEQRTK